MAPPFVVAANPSTWNTLVGGQGGPSFATGPQPCAGFQVSDITLSSAQILAIQTGAITLIPAPGVTGWFLNIDKIIMRLIAGSAANPPTEDNAAFQISKATNNFAAGNGTMHITTYYTTEASL